MRKKLTICLAGALTLGLTAVAAVDLMAAAQDAPGTQQTTSSDGLWGLLEELVRVPRHLRDDRAHRITSALREDREALAGTPSPSSDPEDLFKVIAPPKSLEIPIDGLLDAETPATPDRLDVPELEQLLKTYRTLSPAMKRRLRGMKDADMVRSVERLASAERELSSALNQK